MKTNDKIFQKMQNNTIFGPFCLILAKIEYSSKSRYSFFLIRTKCHCDIFQKKVMSEFQATLVPKYKYEFIGPLPAKAR